MSDEINKMWCLERALEITKAWASSAGNPKPHPDDILQDTYDKLKVLYKDTRN